MHVAARKGYLSIVTDLIEVIDVSINVFYSQEYVFSTRFVIVERGIIKLFYISGWK